MIGNVGGLGCVQNLQKNKYSLISLSFPNCNVLTDFQQPKFFPFQSLGFIIKIFLKYS